MYFDCDTKMGLCFRSAGLLCTSFSAMAVGRQSPGSTILTIVLPGDCRPTAIALKLVQSKPALRKHRPIFVSQSKYIPRMVKVFNAGAYRNQPEFTSGCDARLGFPLANQTRGNQPVLAKMSAGHATCSVRRDYSTLLVVLREEKRQKAKPVRAQIVARPKSAVAPVHPTARTCLLYTSDAADE